MLAVELPRERDAGGLIAPVLVVDDQVVARGLARIVAVHHTGQDELLLAGLVLPVTQDGTRSFFQPALVLFGRQAALVRVLPLGAEQRYLVEEGVDLVQ